MVKRIHSTLFLVSNIEETVDFYKNLGFKVEQTDTSARIIFGDYRLAFMQGDKDSETSNKKKKGFGIFIYFEVEDIDIFTQTIRKKNIVQKKEPVEQPWGKKELKILDPDGYKLVFFENL